MGSSEPPSQTSSIRLPFPFADSGSRAPLRPRTHTPPPPSVRLPPKCCQPGPPGHHVRWRRTPLSPLLGPPANPSMVGGSKSTLHGVCGKGSAHRSCHSSQALRSPGPHPPWSAPGPMGVPTEGPLTLGYLQAGAPRNTSGMLSAGTGSRPPCEVAETCSETHASHSCCCKLGLAPELLTGPHPTPSAPESHSAGLTSAPACGPVPSPLSRSAVTIPHPPFPQNLP